jgi:hypothetical protein
MAQHHFHPLHQHCVECGSAASDVENGTAKCDPRRQRHFILIEIGGTREVFCPRGTHPNG